MWVSQYVFVHNMMLDLGRNKVGPRFSWYFRTFFFDSRYIKCTLLYLLFSRIDSI